VSNALRRRIGRRTARKGGALLGRGPWIFWSAGVEAMLYRTLGGVTPLAMAPTKLVWVDAADWGTS
jgi:hypothetical protein